MYTATWLADQFRAVLDVELALTPASDEEFDAMYAGPVHWPQLNLLTCEATTYASIVGYCNESFDETVAWAEAEIDPAVRLARYEEAGAMLVADVPAVFLSNENTQALVKPYVTGYAISPIDHFPGWPTPLTIDIKG